MKKSWDNDENQRIKDTFLFLFGGKFVAKSLFFHAGRVIFPAMGPLTWQENLRNDDDLKLKII